MQLHTLTTTQSRTKSVAVGRGGKRGKTSGRGTKGQKARAGHKIRPAARDIIKKLPKRRGHGKNRAATVPMRRTIGSASVSLAALDTAFSAGDKVSPATLVAKGLIRRVGGRAPQVKVLATGEITKPLVIEKCALSAPAKAALEKAGATINA